MNMNAEIAQSEETTEIKKKPKKYNGYLRNTNRKQKKLEIVHNEQSAISEENEPKIVKPAGENRPQSSKNRNPRHKPRPDIVDYADSGESRYDVFTPEASLFAFIRQKTGFNYSVFWNTLNTVMQEKAFLDIKMSDMTLLSYSALYEAIDIFEPLLYEHGTKVGQKEFEDFIFPYCMNKNPQLLAHSLKFYKEHYQPEGNFIESLLAKMGKISYRQENNQILLNWFSGVLDDTHYQSFWQHCLVENNVALLDTALEHKEFLHYLKAHYTEFSDHIALVNRKHTVERAFMKKEFSEFKAPQIEPVAIKHESKNSSCVLGNHEEAFQQLQKENTPVKTEITVKRKRKLG